MARRLVALLTLALTLVSVPSAGAATATVADGTLTYIAGAGENNTVSIAYDPAISGYRITDTTAPVTGGPSVGRSVTKSTVKTPGSAQSSSSCGTATTSGWGATSRS